MSIATNTQAISIARESLGLQPHHFTVNHDTASEIPEPIIKMLDWTYVTAGDLEKRALETLEILDGSFTIRGNIETLTKYGSILNMFGLLMSSRRPDENAGKRKYTYIYKGLFGHRRNHLRLDDIHYEVDDVIADGKLKYPNEEEDGKQMLFPYGWAQSVLDLMSLGVWKIDYDPQNHVYEASFHENFEPNRASFSEYHKQIVGRMTQPCWKWELKGPVGQTLFDGKSSS